MRKNLLFLMMVLLFSFCKNKNSNTPSSPPAVVPTKQLHFSSKTLIQKSQLCENENEMECATVEYKYLLAEDGENHVRESINLAIENTLKRFFDLGMEESTSTLKEKKLETLAKEFIQDYEKLVQEDAEYIMPYDNSGEVKVEFENDEIVCLSLFNYTYLGGAHGNSVTLLLNFDKKTGKRISADDLLKNKQSLSPLLEQQIRSHFEIPENMSLNEFGFYFEEEVLPVNDNVGILKDSLLFIYQPYEIAAYALGSIEVKLAKSDIKEMMK